MERIPYHTWCRGRELVVAKPAEGSMVGTSPTITIEEIFTDNIIGVLTFFVMH